MLRQPCGYALLEPDTVSEVECGTAYLTLETKPAIRFRWLYGPVLVTFRSRAARDDAFEALSGLRQAGKTERVSEALDPAPGEPEEVATGKRR